jgi:acetylornithine/N-succinyldiaminopimelate aminotransferase
LIPSILPVYKRTKLTISHGEGAYLFDTKGRKYLDFISGVATNSLGHCHPALIDTLHAQSKKLWHISNIFEIPGMEEFASLLTSHTFADTVFFCNSGAEAIECCIKMVRKYHSSIGNPHKYRIITFDGAFHGRTLAALWASKRDPLMQEGFGPPVEGFDNIPFGDIEAVKRTITDETAAILIEPIQGDGGVRPAPAGFLTALRELCNHHGLLLCFDEIQCGMGRSGKLFAHEHYGVTPDIMPIAKGIGGGFPLGACLATEKAAHGMTTGTHGSTYGGNPMAMAIGKKVFETIQQKPFLNHVTQMGEKLKKGLEALALSCPNTIVEIRGTGLLLGIKCVQNNRELMEKIKEEGLLLAHAGDNVLRLLPPLIIEEHHVDESLKILKYCF